MVKKYLLKDVLFDVAVARKNSLEAFISSQTEVLNNSPKGFLRIVTNKGVYQYYFITKKGDRNGKYISKKNMAFIKQLAQRDYEKKMLKLAEKQLHSINVFLKSYHKSALEDCYNNIQEKRKELIEPLIFPNEKWIKNWKSVSYKGKNFWEEKPEYYCAKGIRVRSKSEIIIADTLDKYSIPYRYEYPIQLKHHTVYPDFYCLNVSTGKEMLWEHFGMMDNPEYVRKTVSKINEYQKQGYCIGKNSIFTFETTETPLNPKSVETIIKQYLL